MKKLSVLVATVIVAMGASFTSCGDSHKSASLKTSIDREKTEDVCLLFVLKRFE